MVEIVQRQFEPPVQMLSQLVNLGSEELWRNHNLMYWKHILHAITGIEFWLREAGEEFHLPHFDKDISPDFEKEGADDPTREELAAYIEQMLQKAQAFITQLDDETLLEPSAVFEQFTKLDVILMQAVHIQHHVGYCNSILHTQGSVTAAWVGYEG